MRRRIFRQPQLKLDGAETIPSCFGNYSSRHWACKMCVRRNSRNNPALERLVFSTKLVLERNKDDPKIRRTAEAMGYSLESKRGARKVAKVLVVCSHRTTAVRRD